MTLFSPLNQYPLHPKSDLTRLIASHSPDSGNSRVVKLSYQAIVAALKIHDLYAPHIEAETDEQMDKIEKEINSNEKILKNSLDELAGCVKGQGPGIVKEAVAANAELATVTGSIIDLSRKNTNIKSLELSLGKKRLITAQCDEVLKTFQDVIRGKETKATR